MRSSYDLLGVEPDADRATIDRAFRNLIKQSHPDRPGGDRQRAEEIIAAYRTLTGQRIAIEDLVFNDRPEERGIGKAWQIAGLLLAIGLLLLALLAGPYDSGFEARLRAVDLSGRSADPARTARTPRASDGLDAPIDDAIVQAAARAARDDYGRLDEARLADVSRACRQNYRQEPEARSFDRCAAYDLAVVYLQDRDPVGDRGAFQDVAVVRRHWANAALLTNDYFRIDQRLDRLKLKVELLLAPDLPALEVSPEQVAAMDQRVDEPPSGASVEDVPSPDKDQRKLSDASNFSE